MNQKNAIETLNIPLNFSEKSKATLRLLLEKRFNIKGDLTKLPYYRNLDGRRWFVGNSGEDENQTLIEMIPEGTNYKSWTEIYRLSILKTINQENIEGYLDAVIRSLSVNCPSLKFKILSRSDTKIYYEWSHNGCNG